MRSIHYVLILLSVLILTLDLMLEKLLQWDLVGTHWEFVGTQWELSGSMVGTWGNVVGVDRELIGSSYGAGTELVCLLSCLRIEKPLQFYAKTCIKRRMVQLIVLYSFYLKNYSTMFCQL